MLKNIWKKTKDKYRLVTNLAFYPYGSDKTYDEECDKSFLRFLDWLYYICFGFIFLIPFLSLVTLAVQKNG